MFYIKFGYKAFVSWAPSSTPLQNASRRVRGVTLNFGPQHPAAHGILRLTLQMSGEVIQRLDPQFGLLHRGTEKLMEARSYLQSLPYFDRFDYVANLFQEHAYCLAIEAISPIRQVPDLALALGRALFDELSRILNHLLTLSAISMDIGAMGPIFWAFEEREFIMELFERVSGARMHTALYKPFSLDWTALTGGFFADLARFLTRCGRTLAGAFLGLLNNRVFKTRLAAVGAFTDTKLAAYGITGIVARSAGMRRDLRLHRNVGYGAYWYLTFRTFLGRRGDNLDRFLIRIKETIESFRILSQAVQALRGRPQRTLSGTPGAPSLLYRPRVAPVRAGYGTAPYALRSDSRWLPSPYSLPSGLLSPAALAPQNTQAPFKRGHNKFSGMEELISHFRLASEGLVLPAAFTYRAVESPKGEVGVTLAADGSSRPYRAKLRTPVAHNMHLIPSSAEGVLFADFVATFCSLDIVLGEIDR